MKALTTAQQSALRSLATATEICPVPFGTGAYGVNARAAKSLEAKGLALTRFDLGDDEGGAGGCAWLTDLGRTALETI